MVHTAKDDYSLSKSKYLAGLQCPKLLWMHYHAKEKFPPTDPQTQARFDQGNIVTELSHALFPGGVEPKGTHEDFAGLLKETEVLVAKRKPLYEGAFKYKRSFARPDILKPNKDGSWDLYEVKSSTSVKDVYYDDVAFQKYCYEGAGLKIRKVYLVYINNEYVKDGPIDPTALFTVEDVTERTEEMVGDVEGNIDRMVEILRQKECPDIKIGLQCGDPYDCALKDVCWSFLPTENLFILNRFNKKKAFELIGSGITHIKDIPESHSLTPGQRIQMACHESGKTKIDKAAIKDFLDELSLPIHFLDFETVGPAVPVYDSSRPYQQVPFQFSLHILKDWAKPAAHHGFLATGTNDPRPELLSKLKALISAEGTILSYNMSFELTCLRSSVEVHPEYQGWFKSIEKRFMDLIAPFRGFSYYDPKQMGRTSIKNVYPALTGGSYEGLEIGDGGTASSEYARVMFSEGISAADKDRVLKGLEEYCKLDTQAMIDVLQVLKKAASAK